MDAELPTLMEAPLAQTQKRPLFKPGFLRRTAERFGIVVAYFVLAIPAGMFRGAADDIGFPVRSDFNWLESILLTDIPNRMLQVSWLQVLPLQHASSLIYVSWFALPLSATLPLMGRKGAQPWRLIAFLMIVYYAGMPFFALYPLEPPWAHNSDIVRVFELLHPEIAGKDNNPYASMPSLHIALPAAASLWYGWRHPFGRALLAYTCLIGVTVIYSGDHYLADVIAGFALAITVHTIVRRLRIPVLPTRWPAIVPTAATSGQLVTPSPSERAA